MDLTALRSLPNKQQKILLIDFGKEFYSKENKIITQKDLDSRNVSCDRIRFLFGGLRQYHLACGMPTKIREKNQTPDEVKEYLDSIKVITPDNADCPSLTVPSSLCYKNCTCWTPVNRYERQDGRTNFRYQGKTMLLHQVSYLVNKGPIEEGKVVMHLCNYPSCYNPDHVKTGTSGENNIQKIEEGRQKHTPKKVKDHGLRDQYDNQKLLEIVKERCEISTKGEWLYKGSSTNTGYPKIMINGELKTFSKLILANKLGKKYEEIRIARHILPDGSSGERHDLNPDHLFDGTRSDNANDEHKDLTKEEVTYIREEASKSISKKGDAGKFDIEMGEELDISKNTVKQIRLGNSYKEFHDGSSIMGTIAGNPVLQLDLEGNLIREYSSVQEAAAVNGYKSDSYIYEVCEGRATSYKGFWWEYKEV